MQKDGDAMGELGKVVRWSAPGSVFLLVAVAVGLSGRAVLGQSWLPMDAARFVQNPALDGGMVLALVAVSVPLGFLLYQVYYFAYSRPHGLLLSFVHMDVAIEVSRRVSYLEPVREDEAWTVKRTPGIHVRWPRHGRIPIWGPTTTGSNSLL